MAKDSDDKKKKEKKEREQQPVMPGGYPASVSSSSTRSSRRDSEATTSSHQSEASRRGTSRRESAATTARTAAAATARVASAQAAAGGHRARTAAAAAAPTSPLWTRPSTDCRSCPAPRAPRRASVPRTICRGYCRTPRRRCRGITRPPRRGTTCGAPTPTPGTVTGTRGSPSGGRWTRTGSRAESATGPGTTRPRSGRTSLGQPCRPGDRYPRQPPECTAEHVGLEDVRPRRRHRERTDARHAVGCDAEQDVLALRHDRAEHGGANGLRHRRLRSDPGQQVGLGRPGLRRADVGRRDLGVQPPTPGPAVAGAGSGERPPHVQPAGGATGPDVPAATRTVAMPSSPTLPTGRPAR